VGGSSEGGSSEGRGEGEDGVTNDMECELC